MQTDDWKATEATDQDGRVRFFMKNMSPARSPADPEYPFLAFVTFRYADSDERGLPRGDDWKAIQQIEDTAASSIEAGHVAIHVAEALGHGVKDLLFYVRDVGVFAERASILLRQHGRLTPSVEISIDSTWSQYTDFP
jgi:hypothetical protein